MSEASGDTTTDREDEEKKKKSLLEDKSKDDLIKIVKKQLSLLQKAKGKSDELTKKCLHFEQEIEKHVEKEKKLLDEFGNSEKEITKIHENSIKEREQEILELKERINIFEKEKHTSFSLINEKEEQIECLSMQLETVKKTCQCFQEELNKYQVSNKEMKIEIEVLSSARDTALESLKVQSLASENKLKDFTALFDEFVDIKKKYNICIEENCLLSSKIEELNQVIREFQSESSDTLVGKTQEKELPIEPLEEPKSPHLDEVVFLIADNEKLVSQLNEIKNENDILRETILSLQKEQNNTLIDRSTESFPIPYQDPGHYENQQVIMELQKHLCDIGSANSELKNENEILENQNQNILMQLEEVKKSKMDAESRLEISLEEKLKLKNEITKLLSIFHEVNEFKTGYEHALLHGAASESLDDHNIDNHQSKVTHDELNKDIHSESSVPSDEYSYSSMGFEYALLGGGSVPDLLQSNEIPQNIQSDLDGSVNQCDGKSESGKQEGMGVSTGIPKDMLIDSEIVQLSKRLEAYTDLLKETLDENESLKNKLEEYKNVKTEVSIPPSYDETFTNTEMEIVDKIIYDAKLTELEEYENSLLQLKGENFSLVESIANLESQISDATRSRDSLSEDVNLLKVNLEECLKEIEDLKSLKALLQSDFSKLETQNLEIAEKLEKRCNEIDDFNSELELLISCISQVIQEEKTSACDTSKSGIPQNLDYVKTLVDELINLSTTNFATMQDLELNYEDLNKEKMECEEKLKCTEELNRFLEEEVKALQDELDQFKSTPNYFNNIYETKCLGTPTELYSIEETNETEEKVFQPNNQVANETSVVPEADTNLGIVGSEVCFTENITHNIQQTEYKDVSLQVELVSPPDVCGIHNSPTQEEGNIDTTTSAELEEQLKSEIFSLKSSLDEKSKQIEILADNLSQKDIDLQNSEYIISELQMKLNDLVSFKESNETSLRNIKNGLNAIKEDKFQIQSDIKLLNAFSDKEITMLVQNVELIVKQNIDETNMTNQKSSYLETVIDSFRLYFDSMTNDFNLWLESLELSKKDIPFGKQLTGLENTFNNQFSSFLSSDSQSSACYGMLFQGIQEFDSIKQKMFSQLHCHLSTVEESLSSLKSKLIESKEKTDTKQESDTIKKEARAVEEHLMSLLGDAEVKMKKLKQISLKLKKELEYSKKRCNEMVGEREKSAKELSGLCKELEKTKGEQCHYVQNYQSLQSEYDKTQDELELQRENFKKLQEDFSTTLLEFNSLKEKISDVECELVKSKEVLDATNAAKQEAEKKCIDLEGKLIIAESKNGDKINKIQELESAIEANQDNIKVLKNENNSLKDQLTQALKEETKNNLLDLEMADYERSVSDLNTKLQVKENELADLVQKLNNEIEKNLSLQEEIKSTEALKDTEEKRATSLKEILEKTKYELMSSKEKEANLLASVSSLQLQLEVIIQQEENCKLQLSESSVEIQHLKEMIKTSSENHQRITRSLESKISTQKQEILCSHKEVETIKQEFENYKIRVHSVLRQQKSVSTPVPPAELDLKEKLETMVDKLKDQVKDMSEKLTAVSLEYETLQDEYETVLQRYNKAMDERTRKDSEWHARLEQLNAEKNQLRITQEDLSSQHLLQNEMLVSTYKKQIKIMSEEHKRTVHELQKQLESADLEISRLQRDQQKSHGIPVSTPSHDSSLPFDILSQERQEGEGSECTDGASTPIRHLSLSTIPSSGFMTFEKLLQSPLEPGTPTNFMQCQECERIMTDLNAANKKIDHLSEVLNDSESTNLRMSEQIRVLKEEVRRLERNKEREEHAENLEYLKNVFIKFSTLQACAEKAMLIPVLTTMLKLSPAEQQQLKNIAGDVDPNDASSNGWGSYLHRWSGLA